MVLKEVGATVFKAGGPFLSILPIELMALFLACGWWCHASVCALL
ncbi:hypothetical protein VII_000420 [Vibrio mimicus MB451]|nr:hypothetical protein VII_000420 [Vibrio mimicus MB451]